ncbi:MFS transporter [Streptomyces sp. A7024]|uniref:MFS transporter n=2 Tax=Streptomyces coryli TaxID=1128680 RepID=A0A6G4TZI5_9ACTN|nr:MFS transporter [Streptomyces coryli]
MTLAAEPRDPWRYRWVVLGVATFTQAAAGFFVQGIGSIGVHLQQGLELSTTQLGLLVSAAQLAPLAGLLAAGELLDRVNERWVVGIGAVVVALCLAAGGLAPGYPALLAVLFVAGIGYSAVQPGGSKSVAAWFDTSRRGLAMGIRQAGLPLGAALASAALPFLAEAYGWRATLVAGGAMALLGAAVFMACYRRPPVRSGGAARRPAPEGYSRRQLLRSPAMVRIMLSGTSLIATQYGVGVLTVLYLHKTAALAVGPAALILVAAQLAGAAGRIVLAALSDRIASGRYATVAACMIAVIAGMTVLLTPAGRSPATAAAVLIWLGFFGYGWYGPWVAAVAEAAPPDRTGFALGLAMSANQIAIILIPPLLGLLIDTSGSFTPAWGLLIAMTLTALLATARRRS